MKIKPFGLLATSLFGVAVIVTAQPEAIASQNKI
jgi:hypothetical protein